MPSNSKPIERADGLHRACYALRLLHRAQGGDPHHQMFPGNPGIPVTMHHGPHLASQDALRAFDVDQTRIWDHFQTQGAASFEGNRGRLDHMAKFVRKGECVLNIGIGNAYFEKTARTRGGIVFSLDPSEKAVAAHRERMGLVDEVQVGFAHAIPFETNKFDLVVMSEVLEHIPDSQLSATGREVFRVLKRGGRFIGTVPGRDSLEENWVVCPNCGSQFHRWGHVRVFSRLSMAAFIRNSGFDLLELYERCFVGFRDRSLKNRFREFVRLASYYSRVYKPHTNIVFVARKP